MGRIFIYILCLTFAVSCAEQNKQNPEVFKKIYFGPVQLIVQPGDTLLVNNGIDSYSASLITSNHDTFHLEYGDRRIIYHGFHLPPVGFPIAEREKYLRAYK